VNFSPGVSREALTAMRQTVRGWHLQLMNDKELSDLSNMFGPVLLANTEMRPRRNG
jgi:RNA-directed DNA polymerase